jgi:hypothetical protein
MGCETPTGLLDLISAQPGEGADTDDILDTGLQAVHIQCWHFFVLKCWLQVLMCCRCAGCFSMCSAKYINA